MDTLDAILKVLRHFGVRFVSETPEVEEGLLLVRERARVERRAGRGQGAPVAETIEE